MRLVWSPHMWPPFWFLLPKKSWNFKNMSCCALCIWLLERSQCMCGYTHSACMGEDVAVCVTFIVAQLWWMEPRIALLGPLVSQRAEADHLGMMHHARGWRPGQTLTCVCVFIGFLSCNLCCSDCSLNFHPLMAGTFLAMLLIRWKAHLSEVFLKVATRAAGSSMLMQWWGFVSAPVNIKQAMSWFQLSQKPSFF